MIAAEQEELGIRTPARRRGREPLEKRLIMDDGAIGRSAAAELEAKIRASSFTMLGTHVGLAADQLCNDRIPLTCSNCQNQPIAQDEATVAVDGLNILAGWNDLDSRCGLRSRQNLGWSTDGGVTFTDGGGFPPTEQGGSLFGDPSHAVNHKTKDFYIASIHGSGGVSAGGVAGVRGHFSGGTFVFDRVTAVALSPPNDFYDKPWMTVDSLSGNVYFSWTGFPNNGANWEINFLRCDANLNPLGPVQTLNDTTGVCGGQFSQIAIGPNGEVYVIWQVFACSSDRYDVPVANVVRRSDDFGATFGPQVNLGWHQVNFDDGGPGFLRFFASTVPSVAVDCSHGPHRGRVYAAWDQSLDYLSAPLLDTTTCFDTEPNGSSTTATPLVPGGKLRGTKSGNDFDWYAVNLQAGETFYVTDVIDFSTQIDSAGLDTPLQMFAKDPGGPLRLVSNGAPSIIYTAPRTATYYFVVGSTSSFVGGYVFYTALVPPAPFGSLARDIRDQIVTWSDDGLTWSAPQRVNDSAPGFDGQYPSLAVDGKGRVYCAWMDFRDDTLTGAASSQYVAISGDGGVHWGPNLEAGDVASYWSTAVCQSNGNTQGDYEHLAADGDRVVLGFTDSRFGDPDVFTDASVFAASAEGLHNAPVAGGVDTTLVVRLSNDGNFARQLDWRIQDSAGWITGATPGLAGSPTLTPAETLTVTATVHPVGGSGDTSIVRFFHSDPAIPGREDTATAVLRVEGVTSVRGPGTVAWLFAPPAPNPSHGSTALIFGLPRAANVRLEIFAVDGSRIRTLSDGPQAPGEHSIAWDGRDDRGQSVPAGSYVARLSSAGRALTRRVVVVR